MEKIDKGLSVAELEAQKVELLPDRIEMRRRRRTIINQQQAQSTTVANQNTAANFNEIDQEVVVFVVVAPAVAG